MATVQELKTGIETANALGRSLLAQKGVTVDADATTVEIMNAISGVSVSAVDRTVRFFNGTELFQSVSVKAGNKVYAPADANPTSAGMQFDGWVDADNNAVPNSPFVPTEDKDYFAHYINVKAEMAVTQAGDLLVDGYTKTNDGFAILGQVSCRGTGTTWADYKTLLLSETRAYVENSSGKNIMSYSIDGTLWYGCVLHENSFATTGKPPYDCGQYADTSYYASTESYFKGVLAAYNA